jgi:hypothetical protein
MLGLRIGLCLVAVGAGQACGDNLLPGSRVGIEEAVGRAQIIVVAKVKIWGKSDLGPGGTGRHGFLILKPSKSLKSGTGIRELYLDNPKSHTFPEEAGEALLNGREEYLFFIEQPDDDRDITRHFRAIKVIPSTKENLDAVADAQRREVRWPGSWRTINEAALAAQLVVVAKVVEVGRSDTGPLASMSYNGYDLQLMSWGDGSNVPKSGRGLVIAGTDAAGLLHVRTADTAGVRTDTYEAVEDGERHLVSADASGKVLSDSPESILSPARSLAIATLKQQLLRLLPPHVLSDAEKDRLLSKVTLIDGHTRYNPSKIDVVAILKGSPEVGLSPTFHVVTFPPEHAERVPVPGDEYVMFIEIRDDASPHVLKMMTATKESTGAARRALWFVSTLPGSVRFGDQPFPVSGQAAKQRARMRQLGIEIPQPNQAPQKRRE